MMIAMFVLLTIGAFVLGLVTSWLAKGYVEDYIENAAYTKAVIHPEMTDVDGNIIHDELLYMRFQNEIDETDDEE
jgi:hypothetical protein|tara:strand:+ start:185 stop:409 length:225 start_codon:yes stop_codon:yes gene_type:complete